jgi:hypothetical protein
MKQENLWLGGCILSKYGAEKITVDGYKFDSKIEAKYYEHLKDLKAKDKIMNFELQPRFVLQDKFIKDGKKYRVIEYVADFTVYNLDKSMEIIDIKGMATAEAKLKRKMFNYQYSNPLRWLVWNKKQWRDFDEVAKERLVKKKVAKIEANSQ